jgi:16S rRNA (adenine1518-N6/adenine1519-N6)-dimethyltransferase
VKARKRFGQHFLEASWVARVLDAVTPSPTDAFLEIGPGHGALTIPLAARAAEIVAVEVDRDLASGLARKAPSNVRIVEADVLSLDLNGLLRTVSPVRRRRVVGNLPYNISTPVLFALLDAARSGLILHDATLMVQREVATRLAASPGGRDYGVLTIAVQAEADVSRLLDLPPGAFRPVPKVHSALIRLAFGPPRVPRALTSTFDELVRRIFMQRRKVLANALKPVAAARGVPVGQILRVAGVDGRRRPETLQLSELVRLAEVFASPPKPPML